MNDRFSRAEIDLESLRKLQDLFGSDGELDEESFVEAFGSILGNGLSSVQLSHLFMKIDANSDGSIDWDELLNYMFLDNQEHETRGEGQGEEEEVHEFFPATYDVFSLNNAVKTYHRSSVVALLHIEKLNQIVTVGREGVIRFWHPTTLVHQSMFTTAEKDWVTGCVHMTASNKLAVSSLDNGISFFDLTGENHKRIGHISLEKFSHAAPLCLGYYHDTLNEKEILLIGDDSGGARVYFQDDKIWSLGQEQPAQHRQPRVEEVLVDERFQRLSSSLELLELCKHSDHITQIEFIPDLSAVVMASLDSTVTVYNLDRRKLKRTFSQHEKAVYAFVWSSEYKVIASCGLERHIILWSPYSRRSVATLVGHTSSIIRLVLNEPYSQLISLSTDNTVKVWDMRSHKCIQTISLVGQENALPRNPTAQPVAATCMIYNKRYRTLLTASNKLKIYPIREKKLELTKAHNKPVVAALYNKIFHQAITIDEKANLSVWDVDSGQTISRFQLRHKKTVMDQIDQGSTKLAAAAAENTTLTAAAAGITSSMDDNTGSQPVDAILAAKDICMSANDGESMFSTEESSVTAMCFDDGGRRVITGSHNATDLKIWNFSNGCLLQTLVKEPQAALETRGRELSSEEEFVKNRERSMQRRRERRRKENARKATMSEVLEGTLKDKDGEDQESAEVTKIAYVVNTLPRIPGHSTIKNKYIVSVGWDRRVYVWLDEASGKEQGYYIRMPERDEDLDQGHTDDIMTISFLPPDTVATGGFDGRIIFWCLNSGQISRRFTKLGSTAIVSTVYINRLSILVATRNDGSALAIDIESGRVQVLECFPRVSAEPVTALCTDISDDILASGDESGTVRVWEIIEDKYFEGLLFPVASWKAHKSCVSSIDYVQDNRLAETFLITGCTDGVVAMWTLTGVPVGEFGHPAAWELESLKSFSVESFNSGQEKTLNVFSTDDAVSKLNVRPLVNAKKRDLSMLLQQCRTTYKDFPKVGEVWLKIDTDNLKTPKQYKHSPEEEEFLHPKCVVEVLTVTRQDEIRNEFKGWNGLEAKKQEKVVPIMDFLKANESGIWIKEDQLSERIGRIYSNPGESQPFKVLYIFCDKVERRWYAIDAFGEKHRILNTDRTYFGLHAPRSISHYYRRKEIVEKLDIREQDEREQEQERERNTTKVDVDSVEDIAGSSSVGLQTSKSTKRKLTLRRISTLMPKGECDISAALASSSQSARTFDAEHPRKLSIRSDSSLSGTSSARDPSRPLTSKVFAKREASLRQRIPNLRAKFHSHQDIRREYRQRVQQIADIPVDFGQLRATLSISDAVQKTSQL